MLTGYKTLQVSPPARPTLACFLEEVTGASMYEFALLASLVAVVSIIILVALNLGI